MEIRKKCWPDMFELVRTGRKNTDLRLADFSIKEGDTLVLEEFDPKSKKYTGRSVKKRVKNLNKVNLTDFHSVDKIKKFGHWIIEMEGSVEMLRKKHQRRPIRQ
jgi:ASC-1-like (ASCH) protein